MVSSTDCGAGAWLAWLRPSYPSPSVTLVSYVLRKKQEQVQEKASSLDFLVRQVCMCPDLQIS